MFTNAYSTLFQHIRRLYLCIDNSTKDNHILVYFFLSHITSRLDLVECQKMRLFKPIIAAHRRYGSSALSAQKWIYAKTFKGEPNQQNFRLEKEELPALKDGEFLAQAQYISVDPYMRPYMMAYPEGSLMIGGQVGKVLESKNTSFPAGATVFGQFGWRTHTVCNPSDQPMNGPYTYVLPDFGSLPPSLGLGVLGMPGNTAYFGLLELCNPKEGETVVVSGAAGAVGSLVGQIAKLKGCRAIGIAGSDAKCHWLKSIGFDGTINYKTTNNILADLKKIAPKGIDVYFDNVGGQISEAAIKLMNLYGRIAVCGTISNYNTSIEKVTDPMRMMVYKQLKMEGFTVWRWTDRWTEGIAANLKWIQEGKLKWQETVTEGFENTPAALIDMLKGGNTGKAVVKV
ncbi:prostaglandin reductase 1-like [Malaya genurostris]|uniref:prostaglandin reductase 1-like n=1 Tax=Malaya genurostris TaxID=325434 RepID=UPI0026F3DE92|nr:prostaglandin reductase 1-like [Malaya genurostris]